jgi:hypothetical protein
MLIREAMIVARTPTSRDTTICKKWKMSLHNHAATSHRGPAKKSRNLSRFTLQTVLTRTLCAYRPDLSRPVSELVDERDEMRRNPASKVQELRTVLQIVELKEPLVHGGYFFEADASKLELALHHALRDGDAEVGSNEFREVIARLLRAELQ